MLRLHVIKGGKIFLPLAVGRPPREVVTLELRPSSHPRVPDTSKADDSGNGDNVEDEGPVLEVTLALKVTPVLTRRAEEKIDVIYGTWVPEST